MDWFDAHRQLPIVLRVWMVVPMTMLLVFIGAALFELPPGPLCDEGMVLFMEGGCDWGMSNIFFFCKAGLLVALNLVFIIAWIRRVESWRGFLPHFGILAVLAALNYSDEYCRNYYSHPNGSLGQMIVEAMAFAALGVALLRFRIRLPLVIVLWNAAHVAAFYLALLVANHWTWTHTFLIVVILGGLAAAISRTPSRNQSPLAASRETHSAPASPG
jgi:hypothetical protein